MKAFMPEITRENIRLFTYIVSAIIFFLFETVFPFKEHTESRWRHIGRNVSIAIVNGLLYGIIFGLAVQWITDWTAVNAFGLFPSLGLSWPWELALSIIILDAVIYIWHVTLHKIPLLWRFHLVHHVDSRLDFTSGFRFHVGEMFASMFFHLPLYFLLGVSFDALLVYQLLLLVFTPFAHMNMKLPGWLDTPLRFIFVTPNYHQVHHSHKPLEAHSNYSTMFSFWDRLFRTYTPRRDIENIRTGYLSFEKNMSLKKTLSLPFWKRYDQQ
jgi:sterol desaturase/sphingolipid hydroxylase (fatty acid hydroxylase superfamily)